MRKYSKTQEVTSVIMIFIYLACMSGCYSTKTISKSEIPLPESSKYSNYPYIIHFDMKSFMLAEPTVSDGILSGTLTEINRTSYPEQLINIYLLSDSMAKVDENGIFSVPIDGVKEVKAEGPDATKTALLATYGVASVVVGVLLAGLVLYGFYALLTLAAL